MGQPLLSRDWWLQDAAATHRLAGALAAAELPGDAARLIALHGALGAGKTTFAQGYLAARGVSETVRSPTYTLVENYASAEGSPLVHADLYRLGGPFEFEELGLREQFQPGTTWIVEWPERAAGMLPAADLEVTLSLEGSGRRARVQAATEAGSEWLARLAGLCVRA